MKTNLTFLTKLTAGGLVAVAIALWGQWLSGDPAYPKFPPGPVLFIGVAAIVIFGARWWWTPLIGALISILVTAGWFARLPGGMLRLEHPGHVGNFAAGIFLSTVLQISSLLLTDIAGLVATVQNFRRAGNTNDTAKMACRLFGGLFAVMGVLAIVAGTHVDKYHNLMHLLWGALAFGFSFLGETAAKRFCHSVRRVLSDARDAWADDGKRGDEQGVVLRPHAAAHRRSHLPPCAGFDLSRHGFDIGASVGASAKPGLCEGMSLPVRVERTALDSRFGLPGFADRLAKPSFLLTVQSPLYMFSPERRTHWLFFFSR